MSRDLQIRLYDAAVLRYNLPVGNAELRVAPIPTGLHLRTVQGTTDMDVRGVGPAYESMPVRPSSGGEINRGATGGKPVSPKDELEISAAGKMLDQLSQSPDLRQERLARIKAEIENGTYDTDAKLEAALSKMFDTLGIDFDTDSE